MVRRVVERALSCRSRKAFARGPGTGGVGGLEGSSSGAGGESVAEGIVCLVGGLGMCRCGGWIGEGWYGGELR